MYRLDGVAAQLNGEYYVSYVLLIKENEVQVSTFIRYERVTGFNFLDS